ncbi:MAG: LamG-like jellyroll fold domain-containing protein [Planctomycetaceae bacterium]
MTSTRRIAAAVRVGSLVLAWSVLLWQSGAVARAELKVGAAAVDVTPTMFPVLVNGGMTANTATKATSTLNARAIVLDDGKERIAIVVVDSCMMARDFLDDVKGLAATRTKIRPDRMLISATHTHTAPASMGCLGTDPDSAYVPFLRVKIADAIVEAESHLEPAQVGWAVKNAADYTAVRRWIIRPDRVTNDPFGNPTLRANMHAGANWDNVTGESGPEDPDLSLISFQSLSGRPIAVLANFSMHYFSGVEPLNADYFGLFCEGLKSHLTPPESKDHPPFVALMSHGCSGDIWRRDYTRKPPYLDQDWTVTGYANDMIKIAESGLQSIKYIANADLAMAETRMRLKYRVPDAQRLQWAKKIVAEMGDRPPKTTEEVYAREQVILDQRQSTEICQQAIRIGDIAIATTPNETYALTGLKLKLRSPIQQTMVIELANGGDGYIPPPEQHVLGGYNTWAARSAGLEVAAEPMIAAAGLKLLETVAGQPRKVYQQSSGAASLAIQQLNPAAYWRMDEMEGPRAFDRAGQHHDGIYEPGVVFFLEGPKSGQFCLNGETNRAAHFAGGRMETRVPGIGESYTLSVWCWNGMPNDGRETAGWIFSRDENHAIGTSGDHVGIGGTATEPGKLIFQHGGDKPVVGRTVIDRWTWSHVVFVREADRVRVYLNGQSEPEIDVPCSAGFPTGFDQFFLGGRSDNQSNWEGRLDEAAVYDRALSVEEIKKLGVQ